MSLILRMRVGSDKLCDFQALDHEFLFSALYLWKVIKNTHSYQDEMKFCSVRSASCLMISGLLFVDFVLINVEIFRI